MRKVSIRTTTLWTLSSAILSSALFAPAAVMAVNATCECTVRKTLPGSPRATFDIAPVTKDQCSGRIEESGNVYENCQWFQEPPDPSIPPDQCLCQVARKEEVRSFPDITDRGLCTPSAVKSKIAADEEAVDCSLSGEDPDAEVQPLIDSKLRSDIRGLDQFKGKTVPQIVGTIVKTAMGILGAIALMIFAYGGILWMLARGNADQQKKGFDTVLWGALGVAVIFASYALVGYIFEAFK